MNTLATKCTCCQETVIKPVFVDGLPYGSYCAKKVQGVNVSSATYAISLQVVDKSFLGFKTVVYNGKKYTITTFQDTDFVSLPINTKTCKIGMSAVLYDAFSKDAVQWAVKNNKADNSFNKIVAEYLQDMC